MTQCQVPVSSLSTRKTRARHLGQNLNIGDAHVPHPHIQRWPGIPKLHMYICRHACYNMGCVRETRRYVASLGVGDATCKPCVRQRPSLFGKQVRLFSAAACRGIVSLETSTNFMRAHLQDWNLQRKNLDGQGLALNLRSKHWLHVTGRKAGSGVAKSSSLSTRDVGTSLPTTREKRGSITVESAYQIVTRHHGSKGEEEHAALTVDPHPHPVVYIVCAGRSRWPIRADMMDYAGLQVPVLQSEKKEK